MPQIGHSLESVAQSAEVTGVDGSHNTVLGVRVASSAGACPL